MIAAARWIARHPDRVKAWAQRQTERPWARAVLDRYDRQARWLARPLRL